MTVVGYLLRTDLRRRWRAWVVLALLVGITGGVSMASFAAWRRTESALDRFVEWSKPLDASVRGTLTYDEVLALPQVEHADTGDFYVMLPLGPDGEPQPDRAGQVAPVSSAMGGWFHDYERPIVVEGRLPNPDAELEVAINEPFRDVYGVGAGDTMTLVGYSFDDAEKLFSSLGTLEPTGPRFDFEITAVVRSPAEVAPPKADPDVVYMGAQLIWLSPEFDRLHRGKDVLGLGTLDRLSMPGVNHFEVKLRNGAADADGFRRAAQRLDPDAQTEFGFSDSVVGSRSAGRAIGLQSTAVLAFGVLMGLAAGIMTMQALHRQADADRVDAASWRAIGVPQRQVFTVGLARAAGIGIGGAVVAVALAIALSPLAPVGLARRAEIDPGVSVDATVLGVGTALVVLFVTAQAAYASWRTDPTAKVRADRVGPADRAARAGLPPSIVAGTRLATASNARAAARNVAVTVLVATLAIVASLGFAQSERRLHGTPELWGWTWDVAVGDGNDPTLIDRGTAELPEDPNIRDVALVIGLDEARIRAADNTTDTYMSSFQQVEGVIEPRLLEGRMPSRADEIALGASTARELQVDVGDRVSIGDLELTYVGTPVFNLGFDAERIGEGALVTPAAVEAIGREPSSSLFLVAYADGVDPDEAYQALRDDWGNTVLRPPVPSDVDNLHRVGTLPIVFAAFVGCIALASLAYTLVTTIRRRRHDLAVLRTLGFERRQLASAVAAQATLLVALPALAGSALGVVVGRVSWSAVAQSLGAPDDATVALVAALVAAPAAILVANLVAAFPARAAARVRPAQTLRAE